MEQAESMNAQLSALATHLSERRRVILENWRQAIERDPALTSASVLSRSQFYDHMPAVLDAFERRLRGPHNMQSATGNEAKQRAAEHGFQRWHHGYNQQDVMREWGHLHLCLVDELEGYVAASGSSQANAMRAARRALAEFSSYGVIESASQYARLQQVEAAGRLRDLEQALAQVEDLERKRAEAWRQAAHDLRGNVGVVENVTALLNEENVKQAPEEVRNEFLALLKNGVNSLHALLDDLIVLSRLEAGHEQRKLQTFDAAVLLNEAAAAMKTLADEKNLFLTAEGPRPLAVQGDPVKIRRIAQNLLLNALKYTERGGVKVTWQDASAAGLGRWILTVQDTGPGFQDAPVTPLAEVLKASTEESRTIEREIDRFEETPRIEMLPSQSSHRPDFEPPGEGIGLSIVKRLCELLDATLEFETQRSKGSTFRIIFPRRYDSP